MGAPAALIGVPIAEIDTPALLLDLAIMEQNIATMADAFRGKDAKLRPHVKTHKTPLIAHKQLAAGAIGITCAKLGEAEVMVEGGIRDILIANQIVGARKIARLVSLTRHADLIVAVDDAQNVAELSQVAQATGASLRVLVEVNVGMHRCGAEPGARALALAQQVERAPGLRFAGLMGIRGTSGLCAQPGGAPAEGPDRYAGPDRYRPPFGGEGTRGRHCQCGWDRHGHAHQHAAPHY